MEMDNPPRSAWRNFPDVLIHAQESAVKKHAGYLAAKSGEIASAIPPRTVLTLTRTTHP
jgi:hypothetical protein